MSLRVSKIETALAVDWDRHWAGCDYATYYHSRHWAELWHTYAPAKHRPDPKMVTFSDGIQALLPLTKTRQAKGLFEIYESGPYNTYGGWISSDPLSTDHAALVSAYLWQLPNMNWMTNPFDPLAANPFPKSEATHTRVFDLRQGLDGLGRTYRQYYHAARRNGLTLRPLAESQADAAFEIHCENQTRWQGDRVQFESRLYRLFFELPHADFMGVFDANDTLLAIALALRSKRHIGLWLANARPSAFTQRPMPFIDGSLISRYMNQGYVWYDVHPSGNRPSLDQAKKMSGAAALPLSIYRSSTSMYQLAQWARSRWKAQPDALGI